MTGRKPRGWWQYVVTLPWAAIGGAAAFHLLSWRAAGFLGLTWVLIWVTVLSRRSNQQP
jgi:hypothetical protein